MFNSGFNGNSNRFGQVKMSDELKNKNGAALASDLQIGFGFSVYPISRFVSFIIKTLS